MEEEIEQQVIVKKKGFGKKLVGALGRSAREFDRKARLRAKNPRRFRRIKKKRPIADKDYGVIMSAENQRRLGINPNWF